MCCGELLHIKFVGFVAVLSLCSVGVQGGLFAVTEVFKRRPRYPGSQNACASIAAQQHGVDNCPTARVDMSRT